MTVTSFQANYRVFRTSDIGIQEYTFHKNRIPNEKERPILLEPKLMIDVEAIDKHRQLRSTECIEEYLELLVWSAEVV